MQADYDTLNIILFAEVNAPGYYQYPVTLGTDSLVESISKHGVFSAFLVRKDKSGQSVKYGTDLSYEKGKITFEVFENPHPDVKWEFPLYVAAYKSLPIRKKYYNWTFEEQINYVKEAIFKSRPQH